MNSHTSLSWTTGLPTPYVSSSPSPIPGTLLHPNSLILSLHWGHQRKHWQGIGKWKAMSVGCWGQRGVVGTEPMASCTQTMPLSYIPLDYLFLTPWALDPLQGHKSSCSCLSSLCRNAVAPLLCLGHYTIWAGFPYPTCMSAYNSSVRSPHKELIVREDLPPARTLS